MEETAIFVPIEIAEEIICRLPVEAFHRFRCVDSSFNKLVSEYRLARKHLSYAIKHENTHLLFLARSLEYVRACPLSSIPGRAHQDTRDIELPLPPCEKGYLSHDNKAIIMKIHNGLVCVDNHRPIFIYDLISGTFTPVSSEVTMDPDFFMDDALIGYDPAYDDYIIVRFTRQQRCKVWIYSLKDMCWKINYNFPYHFPYGGCVFANGRFYWTAKARGCTDMFDIVVVDPYFRFLELLHVPEYVGRGDSVQCLKLINVQEKLYVYYNNNYQIGEEEEEEEYCSIWETPLSAASWTKVFSIPSKLMRDEFRILYLYESLGVVLMMTTSEVVGIRELWWIFRDGTVLYKEALDDDGPSLVDGCIVHQGPITV